ncbi:MAG: SUMF1/EgtB/PvdO family nonheme iron enzyme [Planctomycetota bacterium]
MRALVTGELGATGLEDQALQFQHDVLVELVADLETFSTSATGPVKSTTRRLALSRGIAAATLEGEAAARWTACRERIRKGERYDGLELSPQLGLIPLGPDPASGLEEFLHWLTHEGPIPKRRAEDGRIPLDEKLGVILVLIPGGPFLMGSQSDDPTRPNFAPVVGEIETPVHEVTLAPYLISKYEMTQGQWVRAFQSNPSQWETGAETAVIRRVTALHPVESMTWYDAVRLLPRVGLELCTEAEWERAARAGRTDQRYSGCNDPALLSRYANLRGEETRPAKFPDPQKGHDDGHIIHAPVGTYLPNDYGLHEMTGNVSEWCLDGLYLYDTAAGARGLRGPPERSTVRIYRGLGFTSTLSVLGRIYIPPDRPGQDCGVRPVFLIKD